MRSGASPSGVPGAVNGAHGVPECPAADTHVRPLIAPPRCAAGHITSEQEQIRANLTAMTTASRNFGRWATAAIWLTAPLLAGPCFADALDQRSTPFQLTATIGLWAAWAVGLLAALVPSTVSLTVIRIIAPASVFATCWAVLASTDRADLSSSLALAVSSLVAVVALSAVVGDRFVNGSSYGDERRMPLRPPAALLAGPVELAWVAVVAGICAGPLLLAVRQWVLGGLILVVGWFAAAVCLRALHGLSQRWLVFVPAGMVIVDRMTLTDALLVQRQRVAALDIVTMGTSGPEDTDLTAGAAGPRLRIELSSPELIVPAASRLRRSEPIEPYEVSAVLAVPTRPGWALEEARRRRLRA